MIKVFASCAKYLEPSKRRNLGAVKYQIGEDLQILIRVWSVLIRGSSSLRLRLCRAAFNPCFIRGFAFF
jgi:hypothetical protein